MALQEYKYFRPVQAAQLRRLEMTVRGVVEGVYAGLHKSPHKGFSIEFAEHREYVPGDEIRHLDWTVLAKTDRYYIKQYEQETNLRATICLDVSNSMRYGTASLKDPRGTMRENVTKFEYGATLAASLAFMLSNQQDMVGLLAFDNNFRLEIPQGNGPSHLHQMFVSMEKLTPGKTTDIAGVLHLLANKIPRRGLVIVISDFFDDPDKLLTALQHLRHARHQLVLIQILDRGETELNYNRPITFQDMEDGSRLQIDPKLIRDEYRREVQAFLDLMKQRCGQFRIDYVTAFTDVPWDVQIRDILSRTSRRR